MHLHDGLAEVAKKEGAQIIIDSRVNDIDWTSSKQVAVTTTKGKVWNFDLLVGADGLKSVVRKAILPNVKPKAPTSNCAYRAHSPYGKSSSGPLLEATGGEGADGYLDDSALLYHQLSNFGREGLQHGMVSSPGAIGGRR